MNATQILDIDALDAAELMTAPFECLVLENFVRPEALEVIQQDYPKFDKPGSIPLAQLSYGPAFEEFIEALNGPEFEACISKKFNVDLTDRPTMFTLRARCRAKDGKLHTDSITKIITILIYLNDKDWLHEGGRLRLLRSGTDIEDYFAEVPPNGGTLLAFKRSDNSWHGHKSYEGPRRSIQMNWVTQESVVNREQFRHRISTWFKKLRG